MRTYFVNALSVGLIAVSGNLIFLVNTLWVILSSENAILAVLVILVCYFSVFNELVQVVNIDKAITSRRYTMLI